MKSGALRWPVTIQQKTPSQDSVTGEVTYAFSTFATVRADIEPISRAGSRSAWEAVIAEQVKSQKVVQFVIRYIPGVTEQMRIIDTAGSFWDIKSIIDVGTRNRTLYLISEFGLDQG